MSAPMHWTWCAYIALLTLVISFSLQIVADAIDANTKAVKMATECRL